MDESERWVLQQHIDMYRRLLKKELRKPKLMQSRRHELAQLLAEAEQRLAKTENR